MIKPFVVIIPSAGHGKRFGKDIPKQYLKIRGKTILELSVKPFLDFSECVGICIPKSPEEDHWRSIALESTKIHFIDGGKTRLESVLEGVEYWRSSGFDFSALITHDAVRPCLRKSEVRLLLETFFNDAVDGAILGAPCSDTIKRVYSEDLIVDKTMDRDSLWSAFTPQVFHKESILKAFENLDLENGTYNDEASLIEAKSGKIKLVEGSKDNIKITFLKDLSLAESILDNQGRINN